MVAPRDAILMISSRGSTCAVILHTGRARVKRARVTTGVVQRRYTGRLGTVDTRTRPADITAAVVASFDTCRDERLRTLAQSLVSHLHAFATEVGLTQEEWEAGIRILTATGEITDERRQEFILWSDALGLSMLVDALAHATPAGATESTVLGPFYVPGAPLREYGATIAAQPGGAPAWVHGHVLDLDRRPIANAEVDVWQNADNGLYAVQDPEAPEAHLRARFRTREDGSYAFVAVKPVPYTIPDDGPVGAMLDGTGRHPWRPAHIHLIVRAPGYRSVATHVFDAGSEHLDSDAVFAVKPSLIREFVRRPADDPERPAGVEGEWYSVEFDVVLVRGAADSAADPDDPV
jgi:hydroxyquinol 1,2-dioxygenase